MCVCGFLFVTKCVSYVERCSGDYSCAKLVFGVCLCVCYTKGMCTCYVKGCVMFSVTLGTAAPL